MASDINAIVKPARRLTTHYSNISLFDLKAKSKLHGLSIAQLSSSTQFDNKESIVSPPEANIDVQHVVSDAMFCNCCQIHFTDRTEQLSHYRCDWHRYNLHRQLKGLDGVTEDDFELVSGDVSSISGSDTDSDDDTRNLDFQLMNLSDANHTQKEEVIKNESRVTQFDKIFFKNEEGELLSLYKCLFSHKKEPVKSSSDILSMTSQLTNQPQWAVFMVSSGHFAAAIFKGNAVVQHKTFHRYTVRAKRGSAQSSRDSQGNAPKSAGATLRRYNEAALNQEVQELLTSWQSDLNSCSLIFVRIPVGNRGMFYGGKNPVLKKDDLRIRIIPFPTRRPTFSEVKRVQQMLSSIECFGQEADIEDFIPMSPPRFYCKDKDQLEIRPAIPFSSRDKPNKKEKLTKMSKDNDEEEVTVSDDEFDINPVGPGDPLQEFEVSVEKKKRRRKPKPGKTKPPNSDSTVRVEDPEMIEMKNSLFTACKTGSLVDFENTISKLNTHFSEKFQANVVNCDNDSLKPINRCKEDVVLHDNAMLPEVSVANKDNDITGQTPLSNKKICDVLNCPIGDLENTLLHFVCQENQHTIIPVLLQGGADPTIKNKNGKMPYLIGSTECKNAFRRFMALYPERYDYKLAQIPSPLTPEMEAVKKQKNAERRAVKKKSMNERNKVKKAEEAKVREEEELKDRFVKLSDREKRALAAERRMLQQLDDRSSPRPVLSRCFQCGADMTGKVPFEYSDFKFCTTKCLRDHRAKPKS